MDRVADFLTIVRNAVKAGKDKVDVKSSGICRGVADILLQEGFVRNVKVAKSGGVEFMRVYLHTDSSASRQISSLDRVSRPGRRVYVKADTIPVIRSGMGDVIVSTSKGVMSGKNARRNNLGGELVCSVW
jgi:small subunit ribosomal protein S8